MRTLALNIAGAIVDMLAAIATRAAERALDAQDKLNPAAQTTPAQREVQTARDNLLETIARLATAQEHLNTEHAEQNAALQMHSNQAAQAFMRIQGIQGFSAAIKNTQAMVDAIVNPAPAPSEEPVPNTDTSTTAVEPSSVPSAETATSPVEESK